MIQVVLWDVDGTLLDFHAAEKVALETLFEKFELGKLTEEMLHRYMQINDRRWKQLEQGELNREQVLIGRYEEFFEGEGITATPAILDAIAADGPSSSPAAKAPDVSSLTALAAVFNTAYQSALGDTIVYRDNCYELIDGLRGQVKQYVTSNGSTVAQEKKLEKSQLGKLMDGVFISEQVGAEKPSKEFFDHVFSVVGEDHRNDAIIIGDSLTSDIAGGINAGIQTCWYNPGNLPLPEGVLPQGKKPDYIIQSLSELPAILSR